MAQINQAQWDQFLHDSSATSILQTTAWGTFKSSFGWHAHYFLTNNVGALLLLREMPAWALGYTIAYIPRGPIMHHANAQDLAQFWEEIHAFCRAQRAIFLRVEPNEWEGDLSAALLLESMKSFQPAFATTQPPRTMLISLEGTEDDWLASMNQKTRYNIRLSQKKDLVINYPDDVNQFIHLLNQTGERDDFSVHSAHYYQTCYDLFKQKGKAFNLVATYEERPIAVLMLFLQGKRGVYLYGASSNEERNRMPNHLLQWTAMKICKEHACTEYDLWGIPDEPESILEEQFENRTDGLWKVYRFKRGFGAEVKRTLGSFDYIYSPLYSWLIRAIGWKKKVNSLLRKARKEA